MPREILYKILEKLDLKGIVSFRQSCKEHQYEVDHYPCSRVYYAIGELLPVWDYRYSDVTSTFISTNSKKVTSEEIRCSLTNKNILKLFYDYHDAKDYIANTSPHQYVKFFDYHIPCQTRALFVVSVKNGLMLREKLETMRDKTKYSINLVTNQIYYDTLETSINNLENIYFSKFENKIKNRFFDKQNHFFKSHAYPKEFYTICDKILNSEISSLANVSKQALLALFKSYSNPLYSVMSRHNQKDVNHILKIINESKNEDEGITVILESLIILKEKAELDNKNLKGHYSLMLDFAINYLKEVVTVSKLEDLNRCYLSPNR